jgi:hypothetical protein
LELSARYHAQRKKMDFWGLIQVKEALSFNPVKELDINNFFFCLYFS